MLKKYALIVIGLCVALLGLAGCGVDAIRGSGILLTEVRPVTEFTRIAASGISTVTLVPGTEHSVTVEADNNIMALLETRVENGVLYLGIKDGKIITDGTARYTVTYVTLEDIVLSGSATAEAMAINQDQMSLTLSGSSALTLSGEVDTLTMALSGSGTLNAFLLTTQQVTAVQSSSTSAQITVEESLNATLSGSSSLVYRGDAAVEQTVSGSATIQKAQ